MASNWWQVVQSWGMVRPALFAGAVVVAAEATGIVGVADVVRIDAPGHSHFGKNVAAEAARTAPAERWTESE